MYTTHAEAVGAKAAAQRVDVARAEVEVARVVVASVVRRQGPIVAVGARVGQLAAIVVAQARSRPQSSIDCGYSFLYCIPDIKPSIHVSRLIILFAYFKYASSAVFT